MTSDLRLQSSVFFLPPYEFSVKKIEEGSVKNCGVFEGRSAEFPQFSD
jgi:hypothetical protein